jgi:hypothetical protein
MTEYAGHDALTTQLFASHSLNEGFEIGTRQIAADSGQATSQILAETILSVLRIVHGPTREVFRAAWNWLLC